MQSAWLDNEHTNGDQYRRVDSASKRTNPNRIQVVSKINMNPQRNPLHQPYPPQINTIDQMNQTCVDRGVKIPFRRAVTTESSLQKDQRDKNLLKLMQQQLQLAKKSYEQKIKEQLKQNSIQLSKLKIKIQNNNELIAVKDQLINQLRSQLRQNSPVKQENKQQTIPSHIFQKIGDMQTKFNLLVESQNKLGFKMNELSGKVERVEKGLLSLLACKIANINAKVNQFTEIGTKKLNNIEIGMQGRLKKEQPNIKGIFPSIHLQQGTETMLLQKLQALKQQVSIFKNKEFRYQNSNISVLRNELSHLQNIVANFEKRFLMAQSRLKNSQSSRKNNSFDRKQNSNSSCFFEDYQEVYEDVDSFGEDQFFHPLQESTRKFMTKDLISPHSHHRSNTKPTTHNDSFEKFTSDQQEQEGSNQRRLIQTLHLNLYKLPLPIQVDLAGYLHRKSDPNYLLDRNNKKLMLTTQQLTYCKNKGWITW